MRANIDDLAIMTTAEQGKRLLESCGEILYAAGFIEWVLAEVAPFGGVKTSGRSRGSQ